MVLIEKLLGALSSQSLFNFPFIEFLDLSKQLDTFFWHGLALAVGFEEGGDL